MVIPYEIGMIEHFAHNVPTVIAKEDIINYTNGETQTPCIGTHNPTNI